MWNKFFLVWITLTLHYWIYNFRAIGSHEKHDESNQRLGLNSISQANNINVESGGGDTREFGFVRTNEAISVTTVIMTPMRIGHKHQSYAVIGFLVKALPSSFIERYCTKTFLCQANMKLRRDVKFTVLSP